MCMHALGRLGEKMYNLLKKYNCNTIYHFTERKNLKSIKDNGGLYSLAKIYEMKLKDISYVSNDWSHDADSFKGLDSYIHLCFVKNEHPMAFKAVENNKDIVWLDINTAVLNFDGVLYTDDIANKASVITLDNDTAKNTLDIEAIYKFLPFNEEGNRERKVATYKYEILVPDFIPLNYIRIN